MSYKTVVPETRNAVYYTDDGIMHGSQMAYYLTYASGQEKPIDGVNHADILYYFDWHTLTEEQKIACISQVWMFDADQKVWHPQTAPYGG